MIIWISAYWEDESAPIKILNNALLDPESQLPVPLTDVPCFRTEHWLTDTELLKLREQQWEQEKDGTIRTTSTTEPKP
jgi:hypothetical protein